MLGNFLLPHNICLTKYSLGKDVLHLSYNDLIWVAATTYIFYLYHQDLLLWLANDNNNH